MRMKPELSRIILVDLCVSLVRFQSVRTRRWNESG